VTRTMKALSDIVADPQGTVAIIGAGVSIAATEDNRCASWHGLLDHGLHFCTNKFKLGDKWLANHLATIEQASKDSKDSVGKLLAVADTIVSTLGGETSSLYRDWLRDSVGLLRPPHKDKDERFQLLDTVRQLSARGLLIATTNYDSVLCEHLQVQPIPWTDSPTFLSATHRIVPGVIHLHGHWKSPESVIFDNNSYQRIIKDETFQRLLSYLWLRYHWLYIGCGMGTDDPNFGKLLQWGANTFGRASAFRHFRLCHLDEVDKFGRQLKQLPGLNLKLITYGRDYTKLPSFLRKLSNALPCKPFETVQSITWLFRQPHQRPEDSDRPSLDEFRRRCVPRPSFWKPLMQTLRQHSFAWLRGLPSHGKTTAALLVATSREQSKHPTYYLDLNRAIKPDDGGSLRRIVGSLARPGVLFIIDNVNRDEASAREIYDAWKEQRPGSRLLAVGRADRSGGIMHSASKLADLGEYAVLAQAQPDDLAGIFWYMLRRLKPGAPPPTPPPERVQQWYNTFKGDVYAFCWAMTAQHRRLRAGNWELPAESAGQFVFNKYLSSLSTNERENVLRLAAFAEEEMGLPLEAFDGDPFPICMKEKGLIQWDANKGTGDGLFHFNEPALGELLTAAAGKSFNRSTEVIRICSSVPSVAFVYAARMEETGNRPMAKEVIGRQVKSRLAASFLLAEHLPGTASTLNRLVRLEAATHSEIDDWLASEPQYIRAAVETQPFNAVGQFYSYASKRLPRVAAAIRLVLSESTIQDAIVTRLAITLPHELIQFVDALKGAGLKEEVKALWSRIAIPENVPRFVSQLFQGSLQNLEFFLRRAEAHNRKHFVALLWDELQRRDQIEAIVDKALAESLHFFATFTDRASGIRKRDLVDTLWFQLGRCRRKANILTRILKDGPHNSVAFLKAAEGNGQAELVEWVWTVLARPKNLRVFIANALRGSLHNLKKCLDHAMSEKGDAPQAFLSAAWKRLDELASSGQLIAAGFNGILPALAHFMVCAKNHGQDDIAEKIWANLMTGGGRMKFLDKTAESTAGELVGFVKALDESRRKDVFSGFDAASWLTRRARRPTLPLDGVMNLFEVFTGLERTDLAEAEACAIIRLANAEDWHQKRLGRKFMKAVLSHGKRMAPAEIARFLERVGGTANV